MSARGGHFERAHDARLATRIHFAITLPVHVHQQMPMVPSQAHSHQQNNGPAWGRWICRPLPYHLATAPEVPILPRSRHFLNPP